MEAAALITAKSILYAFKNSGLKALEELLSKTRKDILERISMADYNK